MWVKWRARGADGAASAQAGCAEECSGCKQASPTACTPVRAHIDVCAEEAPVQQANRGGRRLGQRQLRDSLDHHVSHVAPKVGLSQAGRLATEQRGGQEAWLEREAKGGAGIRRGCSEVHGARVGLDLAVSLAADQRRALDALVWWRRPLATCPAGQVLPQRTAACFAPPPPGQPGAQAAANTTRSHPRSASQAR